MMKRQKMFLKLVSLSRRHLLLSRLVEKLTQMQQAKFLM
jgi:hypothetical protein